MPAEFDVSVEREEGTVKICETSDYTQMRRCRLAYLHGHIVNEMFDGGLCAKGFVFSIRPHLTSWPLQWTVTIDQQPAKKTALAFALQD